MIQGRVATLAQVLSTEVRLRVAGALTATVLVGGLVGFGAGVGVASLVGPDRATVGNTGGSLSVVLSIGRSTVVIGGGTARADLADMVDRATLPWRRQVDLLVVPAGDTLNIPGAVGLIEHGSVRGLAILGTPGAEPDWAALEQEAAARHVRVTVVTGQHRLPLSPGKSLSLDAGSVDDPARPGPSAVLDDGRARVVILDWPSVSSSSSGSAPVPPAGHVLVPLRADTPVGPSAFGVLLRAPAAGTTPDATPIASYVGEVASGAPVTLTITNGQIRLPANAVARPPA